MYERTRGSTLRNIKTRWRIINTSVAQGTLTYIKKTSNYKNIHHEIYIHRLMCKGAHV